MSSQRRWNSMLAWLKQPAAATYGCLALLFGGLVVDLNTDQSLVVAIVYNIPIVVSAVLLSRTLTVWTIVLSLAANAAAGFANAVSVGEADAFTVANRGLAGLSFLLVGLMALLFEKSSEDVRELAAHEDDGERERALRAAIGELSGPLTHDDLLARSAVALRALLGADAVVISGLDGERFGGPRWSAPEYTSVAETGKLATWAVDALPVTATPVISIRNDRGVTAVGRLRSRVVADGGCDAATGLDLVVVVERPDRTLSSRLLGEALAAIEPLRERAAEMERLRRRIDELSSG